MGLKPHSRFTVPLCGPGGCHHRQHQIGEAEFFAQLGIDAVDFALQLYRNSGDDDAGLRTIMRAHQSIALHKAALAGKAKESN